MSGPRVIRHKVGPRLVYTEEHARRLGLQSSPGYRALGDGLIAIGELSTAERAAGLRLDPGTGAVVHPRGRAPRGDVPGSGTVRA